MTWVAPSDFAKLSFEADEDVAMTVAPRVEAIWAYQLLHMDHC
jgi:hypothetical protein